MKQHNIEKLKKRFIENHQAWGITLLIVWALAQVVVLSSTDYMEAERSGHTLPFWEPLCWQLTSILVVLLLVWPLMKVTEALKSYSLPKQVIAHVLLTVLFSVVHVIGMVLLRKLWYWLAGSHYNFGNWGYEFLYEYRKDLMTYIMLVVVTQSYGFIIRRLKGEAAQLHNSETDDSPLPNKLLIKKLGKEFLIEIDTIEWIEAAGNYANLHIGSSTFPMRTTMAKLEQQLPEYFCRIHRSRMVNLTFVSHSQALDTGDYRVTLNDGTELGMSRRYRDGFQQQRMLSSG